MKRLITVLVFSQLFGISLSAQALTVDLRFQPTASTAPSQAVQKSIRELKAIKLYPFTDERNIGDKVLGEFLVNGQPEKVAANIPVADYAADTFKSLYEEWGGRISANGEFSLKGEVTQFSFEESEGYQARVGIHFYLADDSGRVIWDGHSSGVIKGARIVTPKTLPNIISDVLLATIKELFEDPKLVGVWSGKVASSYVVKE